MTQQDYTNNTPKISGLALASFIISFLSLCLWVIAAVPAIILGILAIRNIKRDPARLSGMGFAIAGISIAGASFFLSALFLSILLPSLGRARELANRSACAANLKGISTSMCVYANENNDVFPMVAPPSKLFTYTTDLNMSSGKTTASQALAEMSTSSLAGNANGSLWMLVLTQQVSPKAYICKSDPFAGNDGVADVFNSSGVYYSMFQKPNQLSYSIAYPWARNRAKPAENTFSNAWRNTTDSSLPVLSDMAPLNGTGRPARDVTTARTGVSGSAVREFNNFNHNGEGGNVSFADAHVEWTRTPKVGQSEDNIFTSGVSGSGTAPRPGEVTAIESNEAPFDTVMIPLRDGNTGATR